MKRRIAFTLAAIMATTMLSACGGNTPSDAQSQTSGTDSGTSSVTSENTTSSAAEEKENTSSEAATTTAPEETEEPAVESAKICTFSGLNNGYMAFTADNDKSYLYNITEKTFTEIDSKYCTFSYDDDSLYSTRINDDIAFIVYDIIDNWDVSKCYGAAIKLSTGEVILDIDENSDISYANYFGHNAGDMLFMKTEESFEGNTFKFGVMDSNGNWKNDFSDSEVFLEDVDYQQNFFGENVLMYNVDEDYNCSYYIYSLKDKTKTSFDLPEGNLIGSSYAVGDMLLITPWTFDDDYISSGKCYILNAKGEMTPFEHILVSFEEYGIVTEDNKVLDSDTLEVKYDFSEYESLDDITIASPEERYAEKLENPNGDSYIGIYDKSGNEIMKPFKCDISWSPYSSFFSGDHFVAREYSALMIANCATGEVKTYEDTTDELGYYIDAFDEKSGMMIVEVDEYHYLVDPASPETLINPFEIA
ncbi:MAG: hypothetical protein IJD85_01915 [Oscillospiraceae bacterium]|nr:hypothetical protein [Oscillospiraceae bacterium]